MKMNIQLDLSELFLESQEHALQSASISGDEFGGYISDAEEFTLKDSVHDAIVRQAVSQVEMTVIQREMKSNNFSPEKLRSKFESMAKQNMTQAIESKIADWFDSDIVLNDAHNAIMTDEPETISVNDLIERVFNRAIDDLNSRHSQKSLEATITKICDDKVGRVLSKYEKQIQDRVEATASALIQKQVQETLTSTFTMLMKTANNQDLLGNS